LFLLHLIRAHVNFQAAKKPTRERRIQTKPRERERERERELHDFMSPLQLQKQQPADAYSICQKEEPHTQDLL
jgi:hypothetical protein